MRSTPGDRTLVVEAGAGGQRLDKWLAGAERLGSRSRAADALLHGRIWLNDSELTLRDAARRLDGGEVVRLWLDRPGSSSRRGPRRTATLDILYEDEDVLVLAKPAGVLSVPRDREEDSPSLAGRVADYWRSHGGRRPLAVHRLDRDTSGVMMFARSGLAQASLREQFASRTPQRRYLACVHGVPSPASGEWRTWMRWDAQARVQRIAWPGTHRAHEAIGRYQVVESFVAAGATLIEVRLVTGKQHQIRVQSWQAGHPLIGERRYTGPPAPEPARAIAFPRQALHAAHLGFVHPRSGQPMTFDLPPPADFQDLLARLRVGQ